MRAPCEGGLDQVVLTIFSIWDRMRVRFSLSWATTVRFPTLSSNHKERRGITFLSLEAVSLPDVLTVKPKVLGEGLSHKQFKALRDKVTEGPGIFIQAAGGKALVSRVEEHKEFPPLKSGKRE